MSWESLTWATKQKLPPLQKLVLIMLANRNNPDDNRCIPSMDRVATDCGMSKTATKSAVKALIGHGLLTVEHRKQGTVNLSNQYVLNTTVFVDATTPKTPRSKGVGRETTHPVQPIELPESMLGGGAPDAPLGRETPHSATLSEVGRETTHVGHETTHPRASDDPRVGRETTGGRASDDPKTKRETKRQETKRETLPATQNDTQNAPQLTRTQQADIRRAEKAAKAADRAAKAELLAKARAEKAAQQAARDAANEPLQAACRATRNAYREAYFARYGTMPICDMIFNTKVKAFVKRVGYNESPAVAAHYLSISQTFYVTRCHPIDLLLKDAEGLRTQWATQNRITTTAARQQDRAQSNYTAAQEAKEYFRRQSAQKRQQDTPPASDLGNVIDGETVPPAPTMQAAS